MFSATQQIETAAFTSLNFRNNTSQKNFATNSKPTRWTLVTISNLNPEKFLRLCRWYKEHSGFEGNLHVKTDAAPVDIMHARDLLIHTDSKQTMLITAARFSSGTIDFCKNRNIELHTNTDIFSAISSISENAQQRLLNQIFND